MFDKATRLKLRFETPRGSLSVEDLWDLPLTSPKGNPNLDSIAVGLYKQLKSTDDVSFVTESKMSDTTVQLKFDVVKHIIDVRKAEKTVADEAKSRSEQKQKLLSIIAQREDETLMSLPLDELKKAVAELG